MENQGKINNIDEYIEQYPPETRDRLNALKDTIRSAAPDSAEKISWGMPTFTQNGNLVHFAAHKNHIGLYPGPDAIEAFADKLTGFESSKGAIQFPNTKPLPLDLVREIVLFRVAENTK